MDISVVVPLFNEEESLPELFAWIKRVMDANDFTYEVIFVNDGSTDRSWNVIEELSEKHEQVKGIKFRRNYGKEPSPLLWIQGGTGRRGHHHGCRPAGFARRDTRSLPDDNQGRL